MQQSMRELASVAASEGSCKLDRPFTIPDWYFKNTRGPPMHQISIYSGVHIYAKLLFMNVRVARIVTMGLPFLLNWPLNAFSNHLLSCNYFVEDSIYSVFLTRRFKCPVNASLLLRVLSISVASALTARTTKCVVFQTFL